jgi:multicomponent Na+:H+ antiporter subunit G
MTLSSIVAQALIGLGGALILLAGIGVLRFPDVLTRANAATKATGLGLAVANWTRIAAPVSGHIIGRAAYRAGTQLWVGTHIDDLANHYRSRSDANQPPAQD